MNGMPDKHLVKDNIKLAQQIDSWLKKALDEEREEMALEQKLAALGDAYDVQVVVCALASLEGQSIDIFPQQRRRFFLNTKTDPETVGLSCRFRDRNLAFLGEILKIDVFPKNTKDY